MDRKRNATEVFILLAAVYLHDIGMQIANSKVAELPSVQEYFLEAGFSKQQFQLPLSEEALTLIREHHHLITADCITNSLRSDVRDSLPKLGLESYLPIVASVCWAHGHWLTTNESYLEYEERLNPTLTQDGEVRPDLLAAFLRVGDLLDLDKRRVNIDRLRQIDLPDESTLHWLKHHYVEACRLGKRVGRGLRLEVAFRLPSEHERERDSIVATLHKLTVGALSLEQKRLTRWLDSANVWIATPELEECAVQVDATGALHRIPDAVLKAFVEMSPPQRISQTSQAFVLNALRSMMPKRAVREMLRPVLQHAEYSTVLKEFILRRTFAAVLAQRTGKLDLQEHALGILIRRMPERQTDRQERLRELGGWLGGILDESAVIVGSAVSQVLIFALCAVTDEDVDFLKEVTPALASTRLIMNGSDETISILQREAPAVFNRFANRPIDLMGQIVQSLNSDSLMRALQAEENKDLRDFYTDLDFSLGRESMNQLLTNEYSSANKVVTINESDWALLCSFDDSCQRVLGTSILGATREDLRGRLSEQCGKFERYSDLCRRCDAQLKMAMKAREASLFELGKQFARSGYTVDEYDREMEQFDRRIGVVREAIEDELSYVPPHTSQDQEENKARLDQELRALQIGKRQLAADSDRAQIRTLIRNVKHLIEESQDTRGALLQLAQLVGKSNKWKTAFSNRLAKAISNRTLLPSARIIVTELINATVKCLRVGEKLLEQKPISPAISETILGTQLAAKLEAMRTEVRGSIERLNRRHNSRDLRDLLKRLDDLTSLGEQIFSNRIVIQVFKIAAPEDGQRAATAHSGGYRLTTSISELIRSGHNLIVLGEAGAGKTTSLQHFALSTVDEYEELGTSERLCLFVPLGRMISKWKSKHLADDEYAPKWLLETAIVEYLRTANVTITVERFIGMLKKEPITLLLDGIDEAIKGAPWIVDEMRKMTDSYELLQIVTSCRTVGDYVKNLPYASVALLPFTDSQRDRFTRSWFESRASDLDRAKALAVKVTQHLKENEELAKIVKSPLLATVLCVLAKKGAESSAEEIRLPSTEISLYDTRMRLATGLLDTQKGVSRLSCTQEELLIAARSAAFKLHLHGQRDEEKEALLAWATDQSRNRIPFTRCDEALKELVDPCMILVPMSDGGRLGFGHLRFQEFLAAQEIATNRAIRVGRLIESEWWQDTFVFLAKLDGDFRWLIELLSESEVEKGRDTLLAMISARPGYEREGLAEALRTQAAKRRRGLHLDEDLQDLIDEEITHPKRNL